MPPKSLFKSVLCFDVTFILKYKENYVILTEISSFEDGKKSVLKDKL